MSVRIRRRARNIRVKIAMRNRAYYRKMTPRRYRLFN